MKYIEFIMKTLCLVIIVGVLLQYQQIAGERKAIVDQRDSEIAEVEAYNREILAAQEEAAKSPWADGTYEGTGEGFGGDVTVALTIGDGVITDISIVSAGGEDDAYFSQAVTLLDDIVSMQSAEVDSVTGATFSSDGIKSAAADALQKAEAAK